MLIAFEGIDGSGKTVQSFALKSELESRGLDCSVFSFPVYETRVGQLIFQHLYDQKYAFTLDPYIVSLLYATNRMELRPGILQALQSGQIVICNRYTYSNVAFQGAKIDLQNRSALIGWIEDLEFGIFKLPRPDIVVFLDLSPSKTVHFIKSKKEKTIQGPDQYEQNREFLQSVYNIYQELQNSHDNWISIKCFSSAQVLSKERVSELVNETIIPIIERKQSKNKP